MSPQETDLWQEYQRLLREYLRCGGEEAILERARQLGRRAVTGSMTLLEMVRLHQRAVIASAPGHALPEEAKQPVRLADEFLEQVLVTYDMITRGYAEANAQLKQVNEELDRRVRLRTAELTAANQDIEAFSYSVSHDLRAPLRHIDGFAGLLERHAEPMLDDKGRHYLKTISEAAKQMGALIDDLLSFSRLGRAELRHTPVRLQDLVDEVRRILDPEIAGRAVVWAIGELPEVQGDPHLLRLVLQNLIGNALKYTRIRAEARIEIGARREGAEIVLFIRDNGVGFDMRYVERLFGVFQRLHSSAEFEGTGIGLATVRRIVHRHGGRVWAKGEVDRGACFYVALAVAAEPRG